MTIVYVQDLAQFTLSTSLCRYGRKTLKRNFSKCFAASVASGVNSILAGQGTGTVAKGRRHSQPLCYG